ncbi:MAG: DNA polymerase domain-containing protein [Candidatus Bathyarchaeia archaeon]
MTKLSGWLLDAYIQNREAILWLKTTDGKAVRLTDSYNPDFYVRLKDSANPGEATTVIGQHPNVLEAHVDWRYPSVAERRRTEVIHVTVDGSRSFKGVLADLEGLGYIRDWFNVDILHIQRYLFKRGFAPTQKLEVELDAGRVLRKATVLDDGVEVAPPPLTPLIFRLEVESGRPEPDPEKDPIKAVTILDESLAVEEALEGEEEWVLKSFQEEVLRRDPDLLIAPDCVELTLQYLMERFERRGMIPQLGRERSNTHEEWRPRGQPIPGRVALGLDSYLQDGMAGIVERSRFAMVPMGLASRWAPGRLIDSRQCYEALRRDILIPKLRSPPVYETTVKNLVFMDRGGLILSPITGLHENVAILDFESMFPNILIKYNISYETVTPRGVNHSKPGFLGELTKRFLERRLHYKRLRKVFPKDSTEWRWCEQRQSALKEILVCIYGFSGCDVNRYGNVYTYAKINEVSRGLLVRAINVSRRMGYRVLYADCDSVFVQRDWASREDYEILAAQIQEELGLPIALDKHFKFLVLLRQEADPDIEATRRYFGKLTNGELFYRGVELRRHDYPPFLKEFEERLMGILFDAETKEEVEQRQYMKAVEYVVRMLEEVASGSIPPESLIITKMLRRPLDSYRALSPHVSAAIQMIQSGRRLKGGHSPYLSPPINFIYVNAEHPNPFRRVMPADMINGDHHHYDREKYQEMLLDVAETVLGWKGFTGEGLGFKKKPRSLIEEVKNRGRKY